MAYKVNSDGKAPKGLKTGDTVVTGGGTYKITGVNSDGSYKSEKVSNTTTYNYTGSYSNAPSSGGSSGGSRSSSKNTSYHNDYSSTGGDIGVYGNNAMVNGVSWQEMLDIYNDRAEKIGNDSSLAGYAGDEIMQNWAAYIDRERAAEEKAAADEARYEQFMEWMGNQQQPTYENKYDPAMLELMDKILSREDFSYDPTTDPLAKQYMSMYQQEGDRAMRETMANAAASAGGMNSYAITAAQQANNYYNSQMANKIPELYQLAYQMYLQDKESDVQDLGILQNLDSTQYNRYRDTMQDYWNDKNFAYGVYQDAVAQGNWQANFDRGMYESDRNYNYGVTQDTVANNRYNAEIKREEELLAKEQAREEAYALLDMGQMPPSALLQAAGIDEAYASAYLAGIKAQMNKATSSSPGSKGGPDENGYTGDKDDPGVEYIETENANDNDGSIEGLGIGDVSEETLKKLAIKGAIISDANGGIYWAEGWNKDNWEEKLKTTPLPHYGYTGGVGGIGDEKFRP